MKWRCPPTTERHNSDGYPATLLIRLGGLVQRLNTLSVNAMTVGIGYAAIEVYGFAANQTGE